MPATNLARRILRTSAHLSFFQRSGEIYAYHDLWGYCLAMDAVAHDLIRAFAGGARVKATAEQFADRLPLAQIEGFLDTLVQHRVLVGVDEDERARAFAEGHPTFAAWGVRWTPRGAARGGGRASGDWGGAGGARPAVLATRDRALGRPVLLPLGPLGGHLIELCDGERTLAEVAEALAARAPERDPADVAAEVRRLAFQLTHSDRQVLKLVDRPLSSWLAFPPPHLRSSMPFPRLDEPAAAPVPADASSDVVDLGRYHREAITDALEQFETGETTLSHMFREPHEALGGRSYGEAFAAALERRGLLPREGGQLVEIGGGVGYFAQALLGALTRLGSQRYVATRYLLLDLAPALQASQRLLDRAMLGRLRFVTADASRPLPLAAGSADLVVSNEVIADLETVRLRKAERPDKAEPRGRSERPGKKEQAGAHRRITAAWRLIERTGLPIDDAPEVFWLNLGALALVEELARVLRPGGAAVLTEFGSERGYPVESTHLDHAEFSIAFGHLVHVARAAGLEAELCPVLDLLGFDGAVRVLHSTRTWFEPARALLKRRGATLCKLAYTRSGLAALCAQGGLALDDLAEVRFGPVRDRALGLRPAEFQALILRKPPG